MLCYFTAMHSISSGAPFGSFATCNSAREGLGEVFAVDFVHLSKVVHVGQKDRGLDHIGQGHALLGKDGLDVLEGLCGLGRDALGDGPGGGSMGSWPET